ncbi:unnamed protein product [Ophioblennius macclurei]
MDCTQQETHIGVAQNGHCLLKLVNFEAEENAASHETQGLSKSQLVVRRGKPFKLTLLFRGRSWNPRYESLWLEVCLGGFSEMIPVQISDRSSCSMAWWATVHPGDFHAQSVTVYVCSPVLSSVATYQLLLHIEDAKSRMSYAVGTFVLLCNPWLKDDPVYMPLDVHLQEYVKSDYGLIYMGTHVNVMNRPWSFGQYEPGVLEACLQLLQVSPQHLRNQDKDFLRRAEPAYLSRVVCAMVNCNDDMGILEGRWQGSYAGGVNPTEWSGSADILHRWASSNCSPVRYGQCWVFASVLCTVMRVLGIPSRVVTVFNSAHDSDGNVKITEYYTSTGEKLGLSKDSIWNFHVWVECWMRRPDLGTSFDGWQVVDPTPQEKSAGVFCCGPCPVTAIQTRCLRAPYDAAFILASVDADVVQLIVRDGAVVGSRVDTECVGQRIYTKSVNSDRPENLTQTYKGMKREQPDRRAHSPRRRGPWSARTQPAEVRMKPRSAGLFNSCPALLSSSSNNAPAMHTQPSRETSPGLEVSLSLDGAPLLGESIRICVTVTNYRSCSRVLMEHVSAQVKEYNRSPQESFWATHKELHIPPSQVLKLHHVILHSQYEAFLAGDDVINLAVVIKDLKTKERVLAVQEFNMIPPQISIQIEGGDSIQMNHERTARVSFTNHFTETLVGAVLTVKAAGLLQADQEARLLILEPGEKIEKKVSIKATSPGTKLLMATLCHGNSPNVVSRSFRKVSVITV